MNHHESHEDRRRHYRRRTLLGGTLRFHARAATYACRIRNLSESGAQIEMSQPGWVADRFELEILHHDLRVPAKVVWRSETSIGVEFVRNRPGLSVSVKEAETIAWLQAERARLQTRIQQMTDEL